MIFGNILLMERVLIILVNCDMYVFAGAMYVLDEYSLRMCSRIFLRYLV